jgi:hypothetical protein
VCSLACHTSHPSVLCHSSGIYATLALMKYGRGATLVAGLMGILSGCSLFLDLDETPVLGANADAGHDGAQPPLGDAASDGDTPVVGLQVDTSDPQRVVVDHAGRFRLVFGAAKRWQLMEWSVGGGVPMTGSGSAPVYSPWELPFAGGRCASEQAQADDTIAVRYRGKAAVVLESRFVCAAAAVKEILRVSNRMVIWASGRIGSYITLRSEDTRQELANVQHSLLSPPVSGSSKIVAGGHTLVQGPGNIGAFAWIRLPLAPGDMIEVDEKTQRVGARIPLLTLEPSKDEDRVSDLLVTRDVGELELTGRAEEAQRGALRAPVNIRTSFRSNTDGAYVVAPTASGSISFALPGEFPQYEPAFIVSDWSQSRYTVKKAGVVIASDTKPIGPDCVTSYDAAARVLYVQDLTKNPRPTNDTPFEISP